MKNIILEDGSVAGKTFSGDKYTGEVPYPKNTETFAQYRKRVDVAKKNGFHLGDLGNYAWTCYCMGSGSYEGVDSDNKIGSE